MRSFGFSFTLRWLIVLSVLHSDIDNGNKVSGTSPPRKIRDIRIQDDIVDENPPQKKEQPLELMLKLKEQLQSTENFITNVFRSSPSVNSLRDEVESAIETIHESVANAAQRSKRLGALNDLDRIFETAEKLINSRQKRKQKAGYKLLEEASRSGHARSKLKLAWGTLSGDVHRDFEDAKKAMVELAEAGEPEAHMALGFFHAAGIQGESNQARALVHFMLSALGGNLWAQIVLGYRYKMGIAVTLNCERSLQFYQLAANEVAKRISLSEGNVVHSVRLVDVDENGGHNSLEGDLLQYYEYMAIKGDLNAQISIGQLYYYGLRGCSKDLSKSEFFFGMAAAQDSATAMGYLGRIYLEDSEEIKANDSVALDFFWKSAEKNNPVGFSGLGYMFLHGRGVQMDLNKAKEYFSLAADMGWVEGHLQLGVMFLNGNGVAKDYRTAFKYFHLAAQGGHILAYYHLAQMHAGGYGILRSCNSAVELYKNVAERGKWNEYLDSGYRKYQLGQHFHAFLIYSLLAEMGYEVAQSNAAYLMEKGESGLKNVSDDEKYFRAFNYWRRAAQQGYSAANVKLGDYYFYGRAVPVDYEAAVNQYRLASSHFSNAQALFNIGYMHENGLGMPRDLALAKRFYDLAALVSPNAFLPVYLALIKLAFVMGFDYISDESLFVADFLRKTVQIPWDAYAVAFLLTVLWFLISRRI